MIYEPNQVDIEAKAQELMEAYFADDDYLIDALISALPALRAVLDASPVDQADAIFDLKQALEIYAKAQKDFMQDAEDALVAEQGYVKRVDVDQFEFVAHDRRY